MRDGRYTKSDIVSIMADWGNFAGMKNLAEIQKDYPKGKRQVMTLKDGHSLALSLDASIATNADELTIYAPREGMRTGKKLWEDYIKRGEKDEKGREALKNVPWEFSQVALILVKQARGRGGKRQGAGRKLGYVARYPRNFRLSQDEYEAVKKFIADYRAKNNASDNQGKEVREDGAGDGGSRQES